MKKGRLLLVTGRIKKVSSILKHFVSLFILNSVYLINRLLKRHESVYKEGTQVCRQVVRWTGFIWRVINQ